jgi:probable HAF family extracellular repeat protein
MQTNTNAALSIRPQRRSRARRLRCPVAILCLSISTALTAGPLPLPSNVVYRIIPLSPDTYAYADINARGQVALTEVVAIGVTRARLYDGVKVRDLGTLAGNNGAISTDARALNDLGQVTGSSFLEPMGNGYHAYRWSPWSGMVNLSPPGLLASEGMAINNLGVVAGNARHSLDTEERAFRWIPGLGMRDLGALNGYSNVTAMNDSGVVVGLSDATPPQGWSYTVPTRWTLAPVPQPLLSHQFPWSRATDINAAGHIVGHGLFAPNPSNARSSFFWTPRKGAIDLQVPGDAWAVQMNDKDMVVGETATGTGNVVAFVWTPKDGPRLLGTPGVDRSTARDVNKHGQVVGGFNSRAFVWTRAGGVVDLNTRLKDAPDGFELDEAYAISDNGSIVARNASGGLVMLVPGACAKAPPVIGNIKSLGAARPGALLTFTAGFRNSDLRDAHTASWSWGDGDTGAGNVASVRGRGAASGQHAYRAPGVYKVRLTVSDSGGERSVAQSTVVVGASGRSRSSAAVCTRAWPTSSASSRGSGGSTTCSPWPRAMAGRTSPRNAASMRVPISATSAAPSASKPQPPTTIHSSARHRLALSTLRWRAIATVQSDSDERLNTVTRPAPSCPGSSTVPSGPSAKPAARAELARRPTSARRARLLQTMRALPS